MLNRTETLSRSSRRRVLSPRKSWYRYGVIFVLAVVCLVQRLPTKMDEDTDNDEGDDTAVTETLVLVAAASEPLGRDDVSQRRLDEGSVLTSPRTATTKETSRVKRVDASSVLHSRETSSLPLMMPNLDDAFVIAWNGLPAMDRWVDSIWSGNLVCKTIQQSRNQSNANLLIAPRLTHLNITFDCQQLFAESVTGTGNFLLALYMMRSTALLLGNVHVTYTCRDARDTCTSLVLPWLTGSFTTTTTLTATIVNNREVRRSLAVATPSSNGSASSSSAVTPTAGHQQVLPQEPMNTRIMTKSMARKSRQQQKKHFAQACCSFWCTSILPMRTMMEFELRRMALALVGVDGVRHDHPSRSWQMHQPDTLTLPTLHLTSTSATSTTLRPHLTTSSSSTSGTMSGATTPQPLIPNVELDDAVIHFRCGDLFSTKLKSYGFMTFAGYTRHISSEARSIGILTQPFDVSSVNSPTITQAIRTNTPNKTLIPQDRKLDASVVQKQQCRIVTLALVEYLQKRHPHAKISIRNRPDETIALTYARIIMANQSVGAMSTFSVFPSVASFGTGYILRPSKFTPNAWLAPFTKDEATSKKIVLFDEKKLLLGSEAKDLWKSKGKDAVLHWFRS